MKFEQAMEMAMVALGGLLPWCVAGRCVIAGSLRRRKTDVGDIEIVCIPRTVETEDLFACPEARERHPTFVAMVEQWPRVKGWPRGKYTQRLLGTEDGKRNTERTIALDLFMATPENWGLILAIRTGSADFSHGVLARGWCRAGFECVDGMLRVRGTGDVVPVREERDLFALIGEKWVEPEGRG